GQALSTSTGGSSGLVATSFAPDGSGIQGGAFASTGVNFGIFALQSPSPDGYALYAQGRLHVNGTPSKVKGSFKIDHPLDPANKYLSHSFVESPDMMNIYNGNVMTDRSGEAWVELPTYFEALNRDFRYQLTVIGQFAQAAVATEIRNNRFSI